jgi:HK97 family phage prohead protease
MKNEYLDCPIEFKADDISDSGRIVGYGSTFGNKTENPSFFADSKNDIVLPGAFMKSIVAGGRNRNGILMLRGHNSDMIPGVWDSLVEDKKGLKVEGQLALKTQLGSETRELAKMGAFKGLSIGFNVPKDGAEIDDKKGVRYLKEVELWEVSLVAFPANKRARITGVKDIETLEQINNERDLEDYLRDAGLSFREAKYMVSLCRKNLRDAGTIGNEQLTGILDQLKTVNSSFKSE